jgi:hypothetical protein
MKSMWIPCLAPQASVTALMYSGPLSQRVALGLPRHSIIRSSDLMTRSNGREKSTSIAKPSRLKSSMTLNSRMLRVQEAQPETPVALVVRQPHQPISDDAVFGIQLGFVPVAGLADAKRPTRQVYRG